MLNREKYGNMTVSDFTILAINEMKDVLEHFNFEFDNASIPDLIFYAKRINKAQFVDVDGIILSNFNKEDKYTIALKYFQPIDVIEEVIKWEKSREYPVVNCKTYRISSLSRMFCSRGFCSTKLDPKQLKGLHRNEGGAKGQFYGKGIDIIRNKKVLNKRTFEIDDDGLKFVSANKAYFTIYGKKGFRLYKDTEGKTFGVKVATMDGTNGLKYLLSDCEKAAKRRFMYVDRDLVESLSILNEEEVKQLKISFKKSTGRNLHRKWVLKSDLSLINEISSSTKERSHLVSVAATSTYRSATKPNRVKILSELRSLGLIVIEATSNKPAYVSVSSQQTVIDICNKFAEKRGYSKYVGITEMSSAIGIAGVTLKEIISDGSMFGIEIEKNKDGKVLRSRWNLVMKERVNYVNIKTEKVFKNLIQSRRKKIRSEFNLEYIFYLHKNDLEHFSSRVDEEISKMRKVTPKNRISGGLYKTGDQERMEQIA